MKKNISLLLVTFTILTLQLFPSLYPVSAAEEDSAKNNKLTIHYYVQINGEDHPLQGAEIEVFRVADMKRLHGGASYSLLPEYASAEEIKDGKDVTFSQLTVDRSVALARRLDSLASTPDMVCTTDSRGMAACGTPPDGMYLVRQKSASGNSSAYKLFQPYLIAVPYPLEENGSLTWITDVVSEPKTCLTNTGESSRPTSTEETSRPTLIEERSRVQTSSDESRVSPPESAATLPEGSSTVGTGEGDNHSFVFLCISAAAVVSIMLILLSRRGEKHE